MAGRKPIPLAIKQTKGAVQKCRTNPHEPRSTTALCTPPGLKAALGRGQDQRARPHSGGCLLFTALPVHQHRPSYTQQIKTINYLSFVYFKNTFLIHVGLQYSRVKPWAVLDGSAVHCNISTQKRLPNQTE